MLDLPESFLRTANELHGPAGAAWLARLPDLLGECAATWRLTLGQPFLPLTYNLVLHARLHDGGAVVVKAGFPGPDLRKEAEVLRLVDGRGLVGLLTADLDGGVLLLEHLEP